MSAVRDYAAITSLKEAQELADKLLADGLPVGFDVETGYYGEPFVGRALACTHADQFVVGFSITNNKSWARYIPLRHDDSEANLPPREIWEIFRPVLEKLEVIAHHKKFEDKNLLTLPLHGDADTPIRTRVGHDSMLEAFVLGRWKEMGLKALSKEILGVDQMTMVELFTLETGEELTAAALKKMRFNVLPVTQNVINYACDDAALCLELHEYFVEQFKDEPDRRTFIWNLERRISHLMADMEVAGVEVDWAAMEQSYANYPKFSENMLKAVREEFSYYTETDMSALNFASPQQMRKLLYTDMGLSVTRMTKNKGNPQPSTDKTALAALSKVNPAVKKLLEFREVGVHGTRHRKWLTESSHEADGRAHASYNQVRVVTGRFSASDPAIQQMPKTWFWTADSSVTFDKKTGVNNPNGLKNGEDFWTGNFRDFIIAAPGKYLLTYDVSQGELRVLAGVSQEKRLIEAFINEEDVHTLTAAMMLGKEPEDIIDSERQIGKALAVSEKVLTPRGWMSMGSLQKGHVVTTPSGTATIHDVYPQGERDIFRVATSDGGATMADAEHLWETSTGLKRTDELEEGDTIPTAVWEPENAVPAPMDPYTLGVLLCAGTFGGPTLQFKINKGDENLFNSLKFPEGIKVFPYRERKTHKIYTLSGGITKTRKNQNLSNGGVWRNPLEAILCEYGYRVPYIKDTQRRGGVAAEHKFLPLQVMEMSSADRMEILRGIVDARGEFTNARCAEVSFPSARMARDVRELVWSLGGRALLSNTRHLDKNLQGKAAPRHTVILTTEKSPFKNPYKKMKWQEYPVFRKISAPPKFSHREEAQCIALDDGIGLFVAGDWMVTHNTMNFALLYQMGEKSLAETLAITKDRASELYSNYFKQFTSVTMWMDDAKRKGQALHYAETFMGRKAPLWGIDSTSKPVRSAAERASVNYPIQGGLADIVKVIMVRSYDALVEAGLWGNGVMMTMNQHDALTFEVDNSINPVTVRKLLAEAADLHFPKFPNFVIDWELGKRWGSSTPWKDGESVYQDENGEWHVDKGDTVSVKNTTEEAPKKQPKQPESEPVLVGDKELHVSTEKAPSKERLVEFFDLVKRNPGDVKVTLFAPGVEYVLPLKTSLGVEDSSRIALALDGAIVRIPENSASLAAIALDLDLGE
jgi:DNA polymerase I-like protein with 3'-5' exonuclease and polymerase domains